MTSAFVELLRQSNLDYIIARKPFKVGSRSDDIIFASFIDMKTKKLQVKNKQKDKRNLFSKIKHILVNCMFG
jgi:hypothetical protein